MNKLISLYEEAKKSLSLDEYLDRLGPLPEEAIVFGVCSDGLPFLLNVDDNLSPQVLIEHGRPVLETVSNFISRSTVNRIEMIVLSNSWKGAGGMVVPFWDNRTNDLILSLASWAQANRGKRRIVVLVDGLENVFDLDFDAKQNLRWLILRGASRGVFIVASYENLNSDVGSWWDSFKCHVGKSKDGFLAPEGEGVTRFFAL